MSLMCGCDDEWDGESEYFESKNPGPLKTWRGRRCSSCGDLIKPGQICLEFERFRAPRDPIEEKAHSDGVQIASKYHCERCGDLFLSLQELGYCVHWGEQMLDLAAEYAAIQEEMRNEHETI